MTWLQILAQAGVMASIVGVAVAISAYFNGEHIKQGVTKIAEILAEMEKMAEQRHQEIGSQSEQRHQEVMVVLKQQHQDVVELLKKGFGEVLQHRAT